MIVATIKVIARSVTRALSHVQVYLTESTDPNRFHPRP